MTLDEYLKDYSGKIALIKIDTAGAEGYILEGMREAPRKHPETVIFMAFSPRWLQQSGYDPEAMLNCPLTACLNLTRRWCVVQPGTTHAGKAERLARRMSA
jgi:hypothetical protein